MKHNKITLVLTIKSPSIASQVSSGIGVSVNGVCLTVVDYDHENVTFDLLEETLKSITNLGKLNEDSVINLELSIKISDCISGHLVSGHVDLPLNYYLWMVRLINFL